MFRRGARFEEGADHVGSVLRADPDVEGSEGGSDGEEGREEGAVRDKVGISSGGEEEEMGEAGLEEN